MFTPKLFPLFAAAFLTCAYTVPASANDSMATPQSSAMTGGPAPMKPAMAHQKKSAKPMAKSGAMSTSSGMSTGAMDDKTTDHMATKPADAAMKSEMSSH